MTSGTASLPAPRSGRDAATETNRLREGDLAAHDWYRFVLAFPAHLVRDYLDRFGIREGQQVLDPFCGTGTTLVECKRLGVAGVGLEPNAMAHFAAQTKTDWSINAASLDSAVEKVADAVLAELERNGVADERQPSLLEELLRANLRRLSKDQEELLLTNSISPIPLHKTLTLLETIARLAPSEHQPCMRLAVARALVGPVGNLRFGPEVGVGPPKEDVSVVRIWRELMAKISSDLRTLSRWKGVPTTLLKADARDAGSVLPPNSIDVVITSPPYPNEKDYTRTTRLESVLLGFLRNKAELKSLKQGLLRSNTRNVYRVDTDDKWVAEDVEIQRIADEIEARRIEMGKTSGFERLYARVTRLYFGGMARHLSSLRTVLKPGARLAYVVGDQASYLRIMIRTGQHLSAIAERLGYQVEGLDLFRTRLATATREQLREEVVVLRWPGKR